MKNNATTSSSSAGYDFGRMNDSQHLSPADSSHLFSNVSDLISQIEFNWNAFNEGISSIELVQERRETFSTLNEKINNAIANVKDSLDSPHLKLATTGTTSSGKSSIVNLLAGAIIMPVQEREMSAGVVTICHIEDRTPYLRILPTQGAVWECGEWADITDTEIKQRLTDVMQRYNRTRNNEHRIAPPEIELDYPLACFQRDGFLSLARLPRRTRFTIIDLPGLRNITDELNRIVISRCKDALCLVAYNMGETDEQKRSALLQEVVAQIKTIGGSGRCQERCRKIRLSFVCRFPRFLVDVLG